MFHIAQRTVIQMPREMRVLVNPLQTFGPISLSPTPLLKWLRHTMSRRRHTKASHHIAYHSKTLPFFLYLIKKESLQLKRSHSFLIAFYKSTTYAFFSSQEHPHPPPPPLLPPILTTYNLLPKCFTFGCISLTPLAKMGLVKQSETSNIQTPFPLVCANNRPFY